MKKLIQHITTEKKLSFFATSKIVFKAPDLNLKSTSSIKPHKTRPNPLFKIKIKEVFLYQKI